MEMTVRGAGCAAPGTDVVVEAPPGTRLGRVLLDLAATAGLPPRATASALVGLTPVDEDAPLGAPPLLRGAQLVLDAAGAGIRPGVRATPSGALRVLSGPDAGAAAPVPLGRSFLGRGPGSLVPLTDPATSRRHVELDRTPAGTRVRAAAPGGGAVLDGRSLTDAWTALPFGALLQVGSGVLELAPPRADEGRRPAPVVPDGTGGLDVRTSAAAAAVPQPPEPVEVELPAPPVPRPATPVAWAAVLVPALVAVPLAVLWSPIALLLAGTGPLVALVTAAVDRRRRRREHRRALEDHRHGLHRAAARADRALAVERATLERLHPAAGALPDLAEGRLWPLWSGPSGEVSPSVSPSVSESVSESVGAEAGLRVRLGTGPVPSRVVVRQPAADDRSGGGAGGASGSAVAEDADGERLEHAAGPVVVDLAGLRRVVVLGDAEAARSAARALVCQLAVLHPPHRLALRLETATTGGVSRAWGWGRWLPHVTCSGPAPAVPSPSPPSRVHVRVVDGLGDAGAVPPATAPDDGAGTTVVVLTDGADERALDGADAVLRVDAGGRAVWSAAGAARPLVVDLLTPERAERVARALAPLRTHDADRGGEVAAPPLTALLAAATGADPLDPRSLTRHWDARRGAAAAVPVGALPGGVPWMLDLDRDGPHALVAGTTGAGKSSLLVAWLLALAVVLPPEELSVVLVDYKGGATAGRLRGLPHLVGSVTDLDEHLAQRALTSLTAEVRRRERVLAEHGAVDRAELLRLRPNGARLLPRLLVVVDEVRVLVDEVPDLVPGLVRLAAVGRSLGVHLVLATQRPAGAVSADARANTNLRVALRVRDAPDSVDVLDDPGAAHLPPDRPGAALVRCGGRDLERVQVASLVRHPPRPVRVLVGAAGGPADGAGAGAGAVDEVPLLVAALREAARGRDVPRSGAPWMPALPDLLPWGHPRDVPGCEDGEDGEDGGGGGLPLGLLDEPELPAQRVLRWSGTAPLAVCGGPGSGRTSLLRWLAAASTRAVHLVGDRTELPGLTGLAALPQVAAVVDPDDGEHLVRVLQHLTDVVRDRAGAHRDGLPLLLVDGADRVLAGRAARGQRHEAEAAADLLAGLVAAGAPVVLACDAAALSSRALAAVREVLLLAPADRSAAVLAGVPSSATPVHWPPGRALRLRPGPLRECQLPLLDLALPAHASPTDERSQPDETAQPAPSGERDRGPGAVDRVPALPDHLPLTALRALPGETGGASPGAAGSGADRSSLTVGVGGLRADAVHLPLPSGAGALVVGPAGSGRSSALHLLAVQAAATGRPCVLVRPRQPLPGEVAHDLPGSVVVRGSDAAAGRALLAALAAATPADDAGPEQVPLVLVDDAEVLLGSPLEALLLDLADGDGPACALVAAGTSGLLPSHRGVAAALRRHRTGLLLHPLVPGDAELLGARPPVVRSGPAGRAGLVRAGALVVVQLAQP
nr:FtsK/SpoIIIE domain-containing protein [Quadrisphaera sp. RL12-1S]